MTDNRAERTSLKKKFHFAEAVIGAVFAYFMLLGVAIGLPIWLLQGAIYNKPPLTLFAAIPLGIGCLIAIYLEYRTAQAISTAFGELPDPPIVHLALKLRPPNLWLRPIFAVWWLGHAALMFLLAWLLSAGIHFVNPSTTETIIAWTLQLFIQFGTSWVANTHFLCAAANITGSTTIIHLLWRLRFVIDVMIAFAAVFIARHFASY